MHCKCIIVSKNGIKKCFGAFLSDEMQRNCGREYGEQFGALTLIMQKKSMICHNMQSDIAEIPMLCNVVQCGILLVNCKNWSTFPNLCSICAGFDRGRGENMHNIRVGVSHSLVRKV